MGLTTPQKCRVPRGIYTLSNTWFLVRTRVTIANGISIGLGGIYTLSNTWFLVRTRVTIANGISIGLAVFTGLTNVTDRQTDHATPCVAIGRYH